MTSRRPWAGAMSPRHYRRLAVLTACLLLAFVGLGARLVTLQWHQHALLSSEAEERRQTTVFRAPPRGGIVDRHGVPLARSVFVKTVVADPVLVGTNVWLVATNLAGPLQLEPGKLAELLQPRGRTNAHGRPVRGVVVQRRVPLTNWVEIQSILRRLPGTEDDRRLTDAERKYRQQVRRRLQAAVQTEPMDDQVRQYPGGQLAAHVLGFVGYNPASTTNRWVEPTVGIEGLEQSLDQALRGVRGWQELEWEKRGRRTFMAYGDGVSARAGLNAVLTLDATLQRMVETELQAAFEAHRPLSVSCIVVQPRTGEILALANMPNFDPNRPGEAPPAARRNRAIQDEHEPGSTFKVVSISGALDAGVVSLSDMVDCGRGQFAYGGLRMGDLHPYDLLTVEQVVAKSSNIGAGKVGIRLGQDRLYATIRAFGIGEPTGVPLPGERRGTLHPLRTWRPYAKAWIPMGHEVTATPLQMTFALSAVANDGVLMKPLLVRRLEDAEGRPVQVFAPEVRRRVISEAAASQMVQALKTAVEQGTAKRARLDEYVVAGKTGTAEKTLQGGGYSKTRANFASFIGFLPADDPQLCIGVFLDEPSVGHLGGETAAPVFKGIAARAAAYLGLPVTQRPGEGPGDRLAQQADRAGAAGAAAGPPM